MELLLKPIDTPEARQLMNGVPHAPSEFAPLLVTMMRPATPCVIAYAGRFPREYRWVVGECRTEDGRAACIVPHWRGDRSRLENSEIWLAYLVAVGAAVCRASTCTGKDSGCLLHRRDWFSRPLVCPQTVCESCEAATQNLGLRQRARNVVAFCQRLYGPDLDPSALRDIKPDWLFRSLSGRRHDAIQFANDDLLSFAVEGLDVPHPDPDKNEPLGEALVRVMNARFNTADGWRDTLRSPNGCELPADFLPRLDGLPYLLGKRHRDHGDHVAAVLLLGHLLLATEVCSMEPVSGKVTRRPLRQEVARHIGGGSETLCREQVTQAWWFAAAYHDFALPLARLLSAAAHPQQLNEGRRNAGLRPSATVDGLTEAIGVQLGVLPYCGFLGNKLDVALGFAKRPDNGLELYIDRTNPAFAIDLAQRQRKCIVQAMEDWPRCVSSRVTRALSWAEEETDKGKVEFDHGLLALWLLVLHLYYKDPGVPTAPQPVETLRRAERRALEPWVVAALEAIALHNVPRTVFAPESRAEGTEGPKPFRFAETPILALLRLCDRLHAWERPVYGDHELVDELTSVSFEGLSVRSDGSLAASECIRIIYRYDDQAKLDKTEWSFDRMMPHLNDDLSETDWSPLCFRPSARVVSPPLPYEKRPQR